MKSNEEMNTIDIAQLGAEIGMEAKEQTLPNGKVVKSLVWDQENLLKAVKAVKHLPLILCLSSYTKVFAYGK